MAILPTRDNVFKFQYENFLCLWVRRYKSALFEGCFLSSKAQFLLIFPRDGVRYSDWVLFLEVHMQFKIVKYRECKRSSLSFEITNFKIYVKLKLTITDLQNFNLTLAIKKSITKLIAVTILDEHFISSKINNIHFWLRFGLANVIIIIIS